MGDNYVVLIVSSLKCVKCLILGSDNSPFEEKQEFITGRKFDSEFYLRLLSSGRVIVRKITLSDTTGVIENIISVTNYKAINGELVVTKYERTNDGSTTRDGEKVGLPFMGICRKYVPQSVQGYILFFPSFIVFKKSEWDMSIDSNALFTRAWALGCCHIPIGEYWIVDRSKETEDRVQQVDPVIIIEDLLSGKISLDKIPEDPPQRDTKVTEKGEVVRKKFVTTDSLRGEIRTNDGDYPFSNGVNYSYYPSDFFRLKNAA